MFDAIILAGSPNNGPLQKCSKAKDEALIKIGNKYMVEYVIESICQCHQIDRIIIVGPVQELKKLYQEDKFIFVTAGNDAMESLINGIASVSNISQRVLVITADVPLITPAALEDFLALGSDNKVDVYYPVIPKEDIVKVFPEVERTYVNLKEGIFTGGNIFLINPKIVDDCFTKAQEIVKLRKSPMKLCKLLGVPFVVKYLLHRLSIGEIESKISILMNIKGAGIISHYPEIGVDIDKPSDLNLIRKVMLK